MKHRRFLITSALAVLLGLGVGAGIGLNNSKLSANKAEAAGTIDADDKVLISLKNGGWTEANVKTAVYFWGDSGDAFSSKYVTEFPLYDSGNSIYIVDVPTGSWSNFKCVRCNPSSAPATPNSTCWNSGVNWGETGNFNYGEHTTLEPVIGAGYYYDTDWKLEADLTIYLDLNGNEWTSEGRLVCAYFWNNTAGGTATKLQMHNVHGWDSDNDHLYEVTVPGSGYWGNVLFYRSTSVDGGWDNQTADLGGDKNNNVFKLTSYTGGSWDWNYSDTDRAAAYGTYFQEVITCSGQGSITSPSTNWTLAKNEFNALRDHIQEMIRTTVGAISGSDLEESVYRYDYIVFYKQYSGYNDFMSRANFASKSFSSTNTITLFNTKSNTAIITIIVVSVAAAVAIGGYFFLRKRKVD